MIPHQRTENVGPPPTEELNRLFEGNKSPPSSLGQKDEVEDLTLHAPSYWLPIFPPANPAQGEEGGKAISILHREPPTHLGRACIVLLCAMS